MTIWVSSEDDTIDHCRHRVVAEDGTARCRFLQSELGIVHEAVAVVDRDLCRACCRCPPPADHFLPPPLASRLYQDAGWILGRGGVAGCSETRAVELREWAEANLAVVLPGDPVTSNMPAAPPAPRVGLYGWDTPTGVGSVHRFLARQLPVERWLVPHHPAFPCETRSGDRCEVVRLHPREDPGHLFDGLDWVLFCEQPAEVEVLATAKRRGVRLGCVAMWECLDEMANWLDWIDLMICPTVLCYQSVRHLCQMRNLRCRIVHLPWTVDCTEFPFRERTTCRRFLFINGHGGGRLQGVNAAWDGRKGVRFVREAALLVPEISILVRSQTDRLPDFPDNVEVRVGDVSESYHLYDEGDVCVQPSRWEGIGLQLLECQASGLPLITTDGPPMDEFAPLARIPSRQCRQRIYNGRLLLVQQPDVHALAHLLRQFHGADLRAASRLARQAILGHRSLEAFRCGFLEALHLPVTAH